MRSVIYVVGVLKFTFTKIPNEKRKLRCRLVTIAYVGFTGDLLLLLLGTVFFKVIIHIHFYL
jgi:hypothetical protein